MADYLQAQVDAGHRIGGGECAHLASEALRVAGGDFTRSGEAQGTSDYRWSSHLVARLTKYGSSAGKIFEVGDIAQYDDVTFRGDDDAKPMHHTQVVAAVDSHGAITEVFEQNSNGHRVAERHPLRNLESIEGGTVSIYRPEPRARQPGRWEYTTVNDTDAPCTYTLQIGARIWNVTLDKANTEGSYRVSFASFSGGAGPGPIPTIKIGNASVQIEDGAGYELYSISKGQVAIRKI